jgi:hypothetical protein
MVPTPQPGYALPRPVIVCTHFGPSAVVPAPLSCSSLLLVLWWWWWWWWWWGTIVAFCFGVPRACYQVLNAECQQAVLAALVTTHDLSDIALRYAAQYSNMYGLGVIGDVRGWGARVLWTLVRVFKERGVNLVRVYSYPCLPSFGLLSAPGPLFVCVFWVSRAYFFSL